MLRSTSTTQGVVALSSGESEFCAGSEGRVDASVGRGIAVRRGARRIRQIASPTLRLHKLTQDGKSKSRKSLEPSNPAEIGTHWRCHCHLRDGRAGIALRAEVQEITKSHPEVFTVDIACRFNTQSETEMELEQH